MLTDIRSSENRARINMCLRDKNHPSVIPHLNRWAVESGKFIIQAAASAEDIRLEEEVTVESDSRWDHLK